MIALPLAPVIFNTIWLSFDRTARYLLAPDDCAVQHLEGTRNAATLRRARSSYFAAEDSGEPADCKTQPGASETAAELEVPREASFSLRIDELDVPRGGATRASQLTGILFFGFFMWCGVRRSVFWKADRRLVLSRVRLELCPESESDMLEMYLGENLKSRRDGGRRRRRLWQVHAPRATYVSVRKFSRWGC